MTEWSQPGGRGVFTGDTQNEKPSKSAYTGGNCYQSIG
jgi:hypothetical protein